MLGLHIQLELMVNKHPVVIVNACLCLIIFSSGTEDLNPSGDRREALRLLLLLFSPCLWLRRAGLQGFVSADKGDWGPPCTACLHPTLMHLQHRLSPAFFSASLLGLHPSLLSKGLLREQKEACLCLPGMSPGDPHCGFIQHK